MVYGSGFEVSGLRPQVWGVACSVYGAVFSLLENVLAPHLVDGPGAGFRV